MFWLPLDQETKDFFKEEEVVIIMGRGHSGTRVVTRICETLGINVGATEELKSGDTADLKFTRPIKKVAIHDIDCNFTGSRKNWLLNRFQLAAGRYYKRLQPSGTWGWKFPETYLIGPYVHETFPKAKYVHLIRDGRDLAFKEHLTDDPHRKLGRVLLNHIGVMDQPHYLQAARSWEYQVKGWDAFASHLPEGKVIDFKFEDILTEPRESVERLTHFLGCPMTKACETFLQEELIVSKKKHHRENDPDEVAAVTEAIGDTLRAKGFLDSI
ncbi:MAG: sulfotransferase [Verrucomicrobiales bacterium]|nr:sulfotransferase [Verrucomicrobiales bacterium]